MPFDFGIHVLVGFDGGGQKIDVGARLLESFVLFLGVGLLLEGVRGF